MGSHAYVLFRWDSRPEGLAGSWSPAPGTEGEPAPGLRSSGLCGETLWTLGKDAKQGVTPGEMGSRAGPAREGAAGRVGGASARSEQVENQGWEFLCCSKYSTEEARPLVHAVPGHQLLTVTHWKPLGAVG